MAENGDKLVYANEDNWVPVLVNGRILWVSGKYAKVVAIGTWKQTEITRNIVELREFEAGTREQIHTIFNRLDKQDALIESMRELTANVGTLAEGQERIEKNVRAVRQDVDELKAKPMANYEKVRLTIITALASGIVGYVLKFLVDRL